MTTLQINIQEPKLYSDIQNQKSLPHTIAMFNETTQKAIKSSYQQQDLVKCKDANDVFNKLGI